MLTIFSASSLAIKRSIPSAAFPRQIGTNYGHEKQKQTLSYSFKPLQHHNRVQNIHTSTHTITVYVKDKKILVEFPTFHRDGTQTRVVTHGKYKKLDNGIYYKDICTGTGPHPKNDKGDAFTSFHAGIEYVIYDESGNRLECENRAQIKMGKKEFGPGLDKAIQHMRLGGRRMIVIPPTLAKNAEEKEYRIYDVTLCSIRIKSLLKGQNFVRVGRMRFSEAPSGNQKQGSENEEIKSSTV
ncbi:peptidyl-prolyl cis-trans isomerase FKBP20-2, chloroplastic-like isoform X2 [Ziziphus jujuba]|uniref:Rotamase n=1 Tax=Ziziphus jujuba TaxID=326968 RepID=A0ABM4AEQ7_ZIZJJ|nr:peptidyl-prolyl cis-trans isomerase FKBP20-2, chloroplastic-like isoform X2 [Ziziphus jujuba]